MIKKSIHIKKIMLKLFILCFGFIFLSTNSVYAGKKRAIIVVPGIMGSGLFWNHKNTFWYYKNEAVWLIFDTKNHPYETIKCLNKFAWKYKEVSLNGRGEPTEQNILQYQEGGFERDVDRKVFKYGVSESYRQIVDVLANKNEKYEVFMFNYDWRKSNLESAKLLSSKIEEYDEVFLVCHSMGGLVAELAVSERMKNNKSNEMIKILIVIGTPHKGSPATVKNFKTGEIFNNSIDDIQKMLQISTAPKYLIRSLISIPQILPKNGIGNFRDKSGNLLNEDSIRQTLKHDIDSSYYAQRNELERREEFEKNFYRGNTHVLNLSKIPVYAVTGDGINTIDSAILANDIYQTISYNKDGDGSVPNESSAPSEINFKKKYKFHVAHAQLPKQGEVIGCVQNIIEENMKE